MRDWTAFSRRVQTGQGLALIVLLWALVPLAAWRWDPVSPLPDTWSTAVLVWVSVFFYLQGWLMLVRARTITRLGLALAVTSLTVAIVFECAVAFQWWPRLAVKRPLDVMELRDLIRVVLAAGVTWGVVELLWTKDLERALVGDELVVENEALRTQLHELNGESV